MKLTISHNDLLRALNRVTPAVPQRSTTLLILRCLLLEAANDSLIITATDLETGIRVRVPCNVEKPGSVTVPAGRLHGIIRECRDDGISLEASDNAQQLTIRAGASTFNLIGMDPSEYPAWLNISQVDFEPINENMLLTAIERTVYAASTLDSRLNLNALFLESGHWGTSMTATDGHRLSQVTLDTPIVADKNKSLSVLVPRDRALLMHKAIKDVGGISVGFDDKNIIVRSGDLSVTVTARLLDGEFPDYKEAIPDSESGVTVVVDRAAFLSALRRLSILADDNTRSVEIGIVDGKTLRLTVNHPNLGSAKDEVDCEAEDSINTFFAANVYYLLDALSVIDTEQVSFRYLADDKPIVFKPVPTSNYWNMVMPMRR